MEGRKLIPPTLQPLTVSVHVGENEDIVGMATIEVEDIEGCEMPEVFALPSAEPGCDISLQDSLMYTANSVVDAEMQLAEPLPVSFPIYPLGGGKAGSELKAEGSVPLFFYYKKIYKPRLFTRSIGTGTLRDLILDELGVDILEHSRETLFPDKQDIASSPMPAPTPPPSKSVTEDELSMEEYEAMVEMHQREMNSMQANYQHALAQAQARIEALENQLQSQPQVVYENRAHTPEKKPAHFVFKQERREPKKIQTSRRLPNWGETLPEDFFERMEMFREESEANKRAITEHCRREESSNIEKKLAFQNKAFRGRQDDIVDALKDVSLPALYSKNTGANVYNPRVGQYFHPTGSSGLRLTQPPSMMNLPPLKNKMSVLNLFDLGQSIHNPNAMLQRYMTMKQGTVQSDAPVNTADHSRQGHRTRSAERMRSPSVADRLKTTASEA